MHRSQGRCIGLKVDTSVTGSIGHRSQGRSAIGLKVDRASVSRSIGHGSQGRSCIGLKVDALGSRLINRVQHIDKCETLGGIFNILINTELWAHFQYIDKCGTLGLFSIY